MKLDIDNQPQEVRIEMVPLIDIIFCIMTFFILASMGLARQQAISLDLPGANTSNPLPAQADAQPQDRLYVSVDAAGQIYIDQSPVPLNILYDVVKQHQQISPNGLIVLFAAKSARYADVVTVLDVLRSVGGERVALATLPGNSGALGGQPDPTNINPLQPLPNSGDPGSLGNPTIPGLETQPLPGSSPFPNSAPLPGSSAFPGNQVNPLNPSLTPLPGQANPQIETLPPNSGAPQTGETDSQ